MKRARESQEAQLACSCGVKLPPGFSAVLLPVAAVIALAVLCAAPVPRGPVTPQNVMPPTPVPATVTMTENPLPSAPQPDPASPTPSLPTPAPSPVPAPPRHADPAVAVVSAPEAGGADMRRVHEALVAAFEQTWAAPSLPVGTAGTPVVVEMNLVIARDGGVTSYLLGKPSGQSQVDMSVLRAAGLVKRIATPLPAEFSGDSHEVQMQFRAQ